MKKFLLFVFFALPLALLGQTDNYKLKSIHVPYHPHNQGVIPFMEFRPPNYTTNPAQKHPLIIFLHGQGETGYGNTTRPAPNELSEIENLNSFALPYYLNQPATTMTFPTSSGDKSFVVLVPQKHKEYFDSVINGIKYFFERQFPAYYVDEMIKYALANLNVDPARIYLTGLSMGSGLVWDYGAFSDDRAMRLAAIVPVSGNPVFGYKEESNNTTDLCNLAEQRVGVRNYVSNNDEQGFGERGLRAVTYLNNCNPKPIKPAEFSSNIPGGHQKAYWDVIFNPAMANDNIYAYMLSNIRAADIVTPVNLLYFKGKNLSEQNILDWSTTREVNFDRFEILRSSDGKTFTSIATIKSQEGNQSTKNYSFKDKAPKGVSHYQLKQIDRDNTFKLSSVITVNNNNRSFIIEKYPNPVTAQLNISIEGNLFGVIELQVLDLRGNLVKKMSIKKDQSSWKGFIDVRSLSNGMYMLQMKSADGRKEVSNFIKK